jgi:hypothetical protein
VPIKQRCLLVGLIALATGLFVVRLRLPHPEQLSDLQQVLIGSKAWMAGANPYDAVSAWNHREFPMPYPFTAVIAAAPLTILPTWLAEALFMALGAGLLAWCLTRSPDDAPKLLLFTSAPFIHAVVLNQWTPLLAGAALVPWLGFILVCKPNIGLALFAAFPSVVSAASGAALVALSFALWPHWVAAWRAALAEGGPVSTSMVTLPGGLLLLLAALRWRHPEGRLLLALSIVPQTTLPYQVLPLFLIARTWTEAAVIWGGTAAALLGHNSRAPYSSQLGWLHAGGLWMLYCAYLPCLVIVLRQRQEPSTRATIAALIKAFQKS